MSDERNEHTTSETGAGAGAATAMKKAEIEVRLKPDQITDELFLYGRFDNDTDKLLGVTPLTIAPQEAGQMHYDQIGTGKTVRQFVEENCPGYREGEPLTLNFNETGVLLNWSAAEK
ncbi:MAG TPA: hypothetical protein VGB17_15600 [Pyrinomonadaceae bacterium]|jgi:hypothetical protein